MFEYEITAGEDEDHPEGGHVVIVVNGAVDVEAPVRFRLVPADPVKTGPQFDVWHEPLTHRETDNGLVLVAGPDLTESPLYEAGTLYTLMIDGLEGSGQVMWPSISPLIKNKRRTLLARGHLREDGPSERPVVPATELVPMMTEPKALPAVIAVASAPEAQSAAARPMPDAFTEAKNLAQATIGLGPGSITPKDDVAGQAGAMDAQAAVKRLVQNPLAVAAITAAVVLGGQALMKWSAPVAPPAVSVAQTTNGGQAIPANVLYDLLATGQTSPRGVSARDVTGQRAQELAAQALQKPGAARDIAEAQFWLKRAATTANGQDRSARVLTELGTLYAETRQEPGPDYATARSLWEIAAAMGDAGAAYFLGQLHEHGLGVAQDTRAALTWYERAKTLGTFPGVDDAVTRVKGKSG